MSSTFGPLSTTRYAVNGVAFHTIRVPPGRLVDGERREKRELLVSRPFEVGMTLVTQALWRAVTGKSPSYFRGDDHPVEQVSWDDAQAFFVQLEALGLPGFRLPTEAEWAWAAQCGVATRWAGADRFKSVADSIQVNTTPVGGYTASSAVGAFDLSGNVWEWQHNRAPALGGVDAQGPTSGLRRGNRGGSWGDDPSYVRLANDFAAPPSDRVDSLGLRLLRTAP
jgi:formylglycine-generating enzyme